MLFIRKLLTDKRVWCVVAILVIIALIGTMIFGDALADTPLDRFQSYILGGLLLPIGLLAFALFRGRIEQNVQNRVSQILNEGEGSTPNARIAQASAAAETDEMRILDANLKSALSSLKKRRFGRGHRRWLYQLPWYAVIGPPGAGKTTAIAQSGLTFPLADTHGRGPLSDIGGTRNCEWWLTDEAVLIDTAGRYTSQEDPAGPERGVWLGFLRLLKKRRRREPINGIIVAISLDVLIGPAASRRDFARRIRLRVRDIYEELGQRVPVYTLLTKADLMAGFVEFFDDLGQEGREAVWGITFPTEKDDAPPSQKATDPLESFEREFDRIVARLDARLPDRMQKEADVPRRRLVFGFPQQVASLRPVISAFLTDAFASNSFEDPILLRGLYMVSGTQHGQTIDRITTEAAVPIEAEGGRTAGSPQPRSYFLTRLMRDVIFTEASLVRNEPGSARRLVRRQLAGHAGIGLAALALSVVMLMTYRHSVALAGRFEAEAQVFSDEALPLQLEEVGRSDLRDVVPLLDRLRALQDDLDADLNVATTETAASSMDFGLVRAGELDTMAGTAYRDTLSSVLLPRLLLRIEETMDSHADDPEFLYHALKAYLMLGGRGPLEPDFLAHWIALDTRERYADPADADLRDRLGGHVRALLATSLTGIGLDDDRIASARAALGGRSAAKRVHDAIVKSAAATAAPIWRLADHAGPDAERIFLDRRGPDTITSVPGIYTHTGFFDVFLKSLPEVTAREAADAWVLDPDAPTEGAPDRTRAAQLAADATELYLREFALIWDETLAAIAVQPVNSLDASLRLMNVLAAPTSPIRLVLISIVGTTALDRPPQAATDGAEETAATPTKPQANLDTLFANSGDRDGPQNRAAKFAATHFRGLRALVEVPPNSQQGATPPIDQIITDLGALYRNLRDMQATDAAGPLDNAQEAALVTSEIETRAASIPEPIQSWITDVSAQSVSQSRSDARVRLNRRWRSGPAELCQRVTKARYPFDGSARAEASLEDFAMLFGPDGGLDRFFRTNLDNIVDRSEETWRWRALDGVDGTLNDRSLAAMQQAAEIRRAMFSGAAQRPSVTFQVVIAALETSGSGVRFTVDGQDFSYRSGTSKSARLHWPGPGGLGQASISFPRRFSSKEAGLSSKGPWALFRLLDRSQQRQATDGRLDLTFVLGERRIKLLFQSDAERNPLDRRLLSSFQCPEAF
ncbi:type VI secretion system membrane subunit TssM [Thalassococcus sp. S3]|uniref:type VI secretion system membrane subunit TssM n=1 Tax=Thalassococcus sp. S3 TaxID=2017482 RepID=UPI0010245AF4|nr:type VI secretion system membrane subunit TssM [Thalassococcus sp. S3]QBF33982.1 hypothetical protein CFI11_22640 [Thalassococcus sp. S3]